jgi:hypothetical protein
MQKAGNIGLKDVAFSDLFDSCRHVLGFSKDAICADQLAKPGSKSRSENRWSRPRYTVAELPFPLQRLIGQNLSCAPIAWDYWRRSGDRERKSTFWPDQADELALSSGLSV